MSERARPWCLVGWWSRCPPRSRPALERIARSEDVRRVAVMPDVHLSADVCVGTVVATSHTLYPNAVGGDIGCGVAALRFQGEAAMLEDERLAAAVLAGLYETIPTLSHRRKGEPVLPPELGAERRLSTRTLEVAKERDGAPPARNPGPGQPLRGAAGRRGGKPLADAAQRLPEHRPGHSGSPSRSLHQRRQGGLRHLDAESPEGQELPGRPPMGARLCRGQPTSPWSRRCAGRGGRPRVGGRRGVLRVVPPQPRPPRRASGRAPLGPPQGRHPGRPGGAGLIPGSMGTASYHVEGRGCAEALGSSAHGAGRRLSRTDARRQISKATSSRQLRGVWFDHRLADALREEAPAAYKDIGAVLRAQHDLVRILRRLRPVLSFKGS